ncbi:LytTR family DNA-binding domain-containing protein [Algoriphagus limi]|uniref:LytTR family transcriptional regulator DNA-binding domain-containing protein n=1 Tax=Algoriphagus limi TaxID=2975273 RepID=A0ABT2G5L5_9BACT|nr:LytTR family DNA-binding domain-containing protein [Algoriphagus limi]MCS5489295.1 LytTR family transcriptional regulator DNA-binding domain-containing protein [Algoriphagus limi]
MTADYSFFNLRSYKLTLALAVAIFFMFFLLIFQPFGVNDYSPTRIFTLQFIGILTLIMVKTFTLSLFNEFLIRPMVFTKVTLGRIIAWTIWSFIFLGTGIFLLYNYLGNWHDLSFGSWVEFVLDIASVLIFPTVGTFFYFRYQNLNQAYQQILSNKTTSIPADQMIHFQGSGVNDKLIISIKDFIYAQAQNNYVELIYKKETGLGKSLIRTSLSEQVDKIQSPYLVRCHRSYLVNLYLVRAISDGSDMKLYLNFVTHPISVSKSYRDSVHAAIMKMKNFD